MFDDQFPKGIRQTLVLLVPGLLVVGCEPKDVRPGLGGELVYLPVEDWRFTDQIVEVFIETRTWYGIPHSNNIGCVRVSDELFIASYDEIIKYMKNNML